MNTMHCLADRQLSKEPQPDLTPAEGSKLSNDGLVALFAVAAICNDEPMDALADWQVQAAEVWGHDAPVVGSLKAMSASLMLRADEAQLVLEDVQRQSAELVFGAAMVLLREVSTPRRTLQLHSLLASLTVCSDEGALLQETFTRALARRFAPAWKELSSNGFLFTSPRTSVPMLRQAVAGVESGRVGTKALLGAAAVALGLNPEIFGSRIA